MRAWTRWWVATAVVATAAIGGAGNGGAATGGTRCTHATGTATFAPALPVSGSSRTVHANLTVKGAATSGCTGGGVTHGTLGAAITFRTPTNCDRLLSGRPAPHLPSGTLTMKWNTGKSSTAAVVLESVAEQRTRTHPAGTVTAGAFKSLRLDATLELAPKQGDCVTKPLQSVTFRLTDPLVIG